MGKGLQRIAALTASATAALMAVGAIEVGALVGVSSPTVTTTVPQLTVTAPETTVTVPETTVTVPSTPVTPKTTVTTPTVKTPPPPAPKVSTPKVTTPKVSAPTGGSGSGSGSTTQEIVSGVTDTVGGGGSAGSGSSGGSSPTGTVTDTLSTGTSALGSGSGGGAGAGSASSGSSALQALGFFGGGSGSGGTGGPAGPAGPGGAGGNNVFAAGGRGGGLPPTLTAAQAKQLRSALALLEGCMSAIAPLDRQVLAMRAGTGGTGPLARGQVAARLGVSARQVRLSERRGLSGLRTAAAETGCAGAAGGPFSVAGIAMSPLLAFAGANPGGAAMAAAGTESGGYFAAREAGPGAESPLSRLTDGGESGPAWLIVLVTVLFSVAVAALTRELRTSLGAPRY